MSKTQEIKRVQNVPLPGDGLNEVNVAKGAEKLGVSVAIHQGCPQIAFLVNPDAPTEVREFYVTQSSLPIAERIEIGEFIGLTQAPGLIPVYVFEAKSY